MKGVGLGIPACQGNDLDSGVMRNRVAGGGTHEVHGKKATARRPDLADQSDVDDQTQPPNVACRHLEVVSQHGEHVIYGVSMARGSDLESLFWELQQLPGHASPHVDG